MSTSAMVVQLRHMLITTTEAVSQNTTGLALRVIITSVNKIGMAMSEPAAQISGSILAIFDRNLTCKKWPNYIRKKK